MACGLLALALSTSCCICIRNCGCINRHIPQNPRDISAEWLTDLLRRNGHLGPSNVISSISMKVLDDGIGMTSSLAFITPTYVDPAAAKGEGLPDLFVAKLPNHSKMLRISAKVAKMPEQEFGFYTQWGGRAPIHTPTLYGHEYDAKTGDYCMVLSSYHPSVGGDARLGVAPDQAADLVRALARFHAFFWQNKRLAETPYIRTFDHKSRAVIIKMFKDAWPVFQEKCGKRFGKPLLPEIVAAGDSVVANAWDVLRDWSQPPLTYCHGDTKLENVYFPNEFGEGKLGLIDWQLGYKGKGGFDISYFIVRSYSVEERAAAEKHLLPIYMKALEEKSVTYDPYALWDDYRRGILYLFVIQVMGAKNLPSASENERVDETTGNTLARLLAAVEDTTAWDVLPEVAPAGKKHGRGYRVAPERGGEEAGKEGRPLPPPFRGALFAVERTEGYDEGSTPMNGSFRESTASMDERRRNSEDPAMNYQSVSSFDDAPLKAHERSRRSLPSTLAPLERSTPDVSNVDASGPGAGLREIEARARLS